MTTLQITPLNTDEPATLYSHYPSEFEAQDCWISLDLNDGELAADTNPEIGNAVSMSIYHSRVLTWAIPCLTAAGANELLDDIKDLAQRILNDSAIEWDGNNNVGRLGEDAETASDEISALISERCEDGYYPQVIELDASSWINEPAHLGVTADMSDDDLGRLAEEIREEAQENHDGHDSDYVVFWGLAAYLTDTRDEARSVASEKLVETAKEATDAVSRRNALICRFAGWGMSSREIAALADLSHTAVQKIVARTDLTK